MFWKSMSYTIGVTIVVVFVLLVASQIIIPMIMIALGGGK